jgi:Glycosyl hydrolases family 38 N-terminal domain
MHTRIGIRILLSGFLFVSPQLVRAAQPDVYVVPFSHLDLYWAGTQEECLSRGNRIITKALRMALQYPEFRFLIEDEVWLANYAETHRGLPEMDQLKQLVKEGRIEISPKWAAILQNLPRGEAWVRNFVYGKRYARDVFGVDPKVANLGFDDARLDTLFLAMPISWKGTLQQYVGRLHRLHDNKRLVQVYDYVDDNVLMLARLYERRLKGYAAIGYTIESPTPTAKCQPNAASGASTADDDGW